MTLFRQAIAPIFYHRAAHRFTSTTCATPPNSPKPHKQHSTPFSARLWTSTLPLAHAAYDTAFIQGIQAGTLSPELYGQYAVQDALYGSLVQADWQLAYSRSKDPAVRDLAAARATSWKKYNEEALHAWHIADPSAVQLAAPMRAYARLEAVVAKSADPVCMAVVMLPCNRLWYWLATRIRDNCHDDAESRNLYRFWFERNGESDSGAKKLEGVIDRYADILDCQLAYRVFTMAMVGEVNAFRAACNEDPLRMEDAIRMCSRDEESRDSQRDSV